jgi:antitoxin component YwqK of YwqJK toxin-antitoxin module
MTTASATLQIAQVPYEDGSVHFRYERCLSADGTKWIRHGLFRAFHRNGQLASEGQYLHGQESGLWRDYHDNGRLAAAEGSFQSGVEIGTWRFWASDGTPETQSDGGST